MFRLVDSLLMSLTMINMRDILQKLGVSPSGGSKSVLAARIQNQLRATFESTWPIGAALPRTAGSLEHATIADLNPYGLHYYITNAIDTLYGTNDSAPSASLADPPSTSKPEYPFIPNSRAVRILRSEMHKGNFNFVKFFSTLPYQNFGKYKIEEIFNAIGLSPFDVISYFAQNENTQFMDETLMAFAREIITPKLTKALDDYVLSIITGQVITPPNFGTDQIEYTPVKGRGDERSIPYIEWTTRGVTFSNIPYGLYSVTSFAYVVKVGGLDVYLHNDIIRAVRALPKASAIRLYTAIYNVASRNKAIADEIQVYKDGVVSDMYESLMNISNLGRIILACSGETYIEDVHDMSYFNRRITHMIESVPEQISSSIPAMKVLLEIIKAQNPVIARELTGSSSFLPKLAPNMFTNISTNTILKRELPKMFTDEFPHIEPTVDYPELLLRESDIGSLVDSIRRQRPRVARGEEEPQSLTDVDIPNTPEAVHNIFEMYPVYKNNLLEFPFKYQAGANTNTISAIYSLACLGVNLTGFRLDGSDVNMFTRAAFNSVNILLLGGLGVTQETARPFPKSFIDELQFSRVVSQKMAEILGIKPSVLITTEIMTTILTRGYINPVPIDPEVSARAARWDSYDQAKRNIIGQVYPENDGSANLGFILGKPVPAFDAYIDVLKNEPAILDQIQKNLGMFIPAGVSAWDYICAALPSISAIINRTPDDIASTKPLPQILQYLTDQEIMQKSGAYIPYTSRRELVERTTAFSNGESTFFHPIGLKDPINKLTITTAIFGVDGGDPTSDPNVFWLAYGNRTSYGFYTISELAQGFGNTFSSDESPTSPSTPSAAAPGAKSTGDTRVSRVMDPKSIGDKWIQVPETELPKLITLVNQYMMSIPADEQEAVKMLLENVQATYNFVSISDAGDKVFYNAVSKLGGKARGLIIQAFQDMFAIGMYFRHWSGPGHKFPITEKDSQAKLAGGKSFDTDGSTAESRAKFEATIEELIKISPDAVRLINDCRTVEHGYSKIAHSDRLFGQFWDTVTGRAAARTHEMRVKNAVDEENLRRSQAGEAKMTEAEQSLFIRTNVRGRNAEGSYCIRMASSIMVGTGYHYGKILGVDVAEGLRGGPYDPKTISRIM